MKYFLVGLIALFSINLYAGEIGRIDAVYLEERRVVIDETGYQLADNVVVIGSDGKTTTLFALKHGRRIDFQASGYVITELRLLAKQPKLRTVKKDDCQMILANNANRGA